MEDGHSILEKFLRRCQVKTAPANEEPEPDLLLVRQNQSFGEPFGDTGLVDLQSGEQFRIDLVAGDGLEFIFLRSEMRIFGAIGFKVSKIKAGFSGVAGIGVKQILSGHGKGPPCGDYQGMVGVHPASMTRSSLSS